MKILPSLIAGTALIFMASRVTAAVVLVDDFNDGVPLTGPTVGAWAAADGTPTEAGGSLTLTAGPGIYAESNIRTAVGSNLNIFTSAIRIEARGFSQTSTGDFVPYENFRVGLNARSTTGGGLNFYGSDDSVSLRISNDAKVFAVGFKVNKANAGDPGDITGMVATTGSISGTLAFAIVGFDLTFTSTTWEAIYYGAGGGETSINRGTWSLGQYESAWGNATEGLGNSALDMYAQNGNGTVGFTGTSSFTLGSINVTSTAVPEPSRGLLLLGAAMGLCLRRRRSL